MSLFSNQQHQNRRDLASCSSMMSERWIDPSDRFRSRLIQMSGDIQYGTWFNPQFVSLRFWYRCMQHTRLKVIALLQDRIATNKHTSLPRTDEVSTRLSRLVQKVGYTKQELRLTLDHIRLSLFLWQATYATSHAAIKLGLAFQTTKPVCLSALRTILLTVKPDHNVWCLWLDARLDSSPTLSSNCHTILHHDDLTAEWSRRISQCSAYLLHSWSEFSSRKILVPRLQKFHLSLFGSERIECLASNAIFLQCGWLQSYETCCWRWHAFDHAIEETIRSVYENHGGSKTLTLTIRVEIGYLESSDQGEQVVCRRCCS